MSSNIKKGEKFSSNNIRSIRPGFGLHPKYYNQIIGKTAKKDFIPGDRLSTKDLDL